MDKWLANSSLLLRGVCFGGQVCACERGFCHCFGLGNLSDEICVNLLQRQQEYETVEGQKAGEKGRGKCERVQGERATEG